MCVLGACNDFLDKEPLSKVTPEKYLWAESELGAYAINQYNFLTPGTTMGSKGGPQYEDSDTDNQADLSVADKWHPGKWQVGGSGGTWNFSRIYTCNYFLNTVVPRWTEGRITGDAENVKHYIGEMYFLRAYEYFEKLKKLGDFPIIRTVQTDDEAALIEASKRTPRNEVARFIISDLDSAIMLLKPVAPGKTNRISRKVAQLFKSRVALFEGTWLKYHQGTALVPNGPGWPGSTKEYSRGYSFPTGNIDGEISYFLQEAMSAAKEVADGVQLTANNGLMNVTSEVGNAYYDMFAKSDLSAYPEVLLWRAYDATLVAHSTNHFLQYNGGGNGYTRSLVDCFLMKNGLPIYASDSGYAGDDFIGDVKIDRDSRLVLFMKAPGETLALTGVAKPMYEPERPWIYGGQGDKERHCTGYAVKKGLSTDYTQQEQVKCTVGTVIFRAAEAYLNYLEACYEKNGTLDADAQKYWKALRARALVDTDYNKTIAATEMEKEKADLGAYSRGSLVNATLYNIRRERRCEFIGDGMRWADLIRWRSMDQLPDVRTAPDGYQIEGIKVHGPMMEALYNKPGQDPVLFWGSDNANCSSPERSLYLRPYQVVEKSSNLDLNGYNWCEAHYLEPIAASHFVYASPDHTAENSVVYQNPGWSMNSGEGAIGYVFN